MELGSIGEWMGSASTLIAVCVSLYFSTKSNKSDINIISASANENYVYVDVSNLGVASDSIKFVLRLDASELKDSRIKIDVRKIISQYSSSNIKIVNDNGVEEKYSVGRRYKISGRNVVQIKIYNMNSLSKSLDDILNEGIKHMLYLSVIDIYGKENKTKDLLIFQHFNVKTDKR